MLDQTSIWLAPCTTDAAVCRATPLEGLSDQHTHTHTCCAGKIGHLYPSGDYVEAARLIRALIEDPTACKAMASAGSAEVEKFG